MADSRTDSDRRRLRRAVTASTDPQVFLLFVIASDQSSVSTLLNPRDGLTLSVTKSPGKDIAAKACLYMSSCSLLGFGHVCKPLFAHTKNNGLCFCAPPDCQSSAGNPETRQGKRTRKPSSYDLLRAI
jgi:hypothetical protein